MRKFTKWITLGLAAVVGNLAVSPANAITIGAGDSARVDFVFTGADPTSSFSAVNYGFNFGDQSALANTQPLADVWDPGDSIRINWFLSDGTAVSNDRIQGPNLFSNPNTGWFTSENLTVLLSGSSDIRIYGIVTGLAGSVDFVSASLALFGSTATTRVTVTPTAVAPVPLPAGGALLVTAMLGFGLARRRKTGS